MVRSQHETKDNVDERSRCRMERQLLVLMDTLSSLEGNVLYSKRISLCFCQDHCTSVMASMQEKAREFVRAVSDLHDSLRKSPDSRGAFDTSQLLTDSMALSVERLLVKQEEFRTSGVSSLVDIGYHYTEASHMASIRSHGLLSRSELVQKGISHKYTGSSYGEGIYTCDNPKTYRNSYGPVCLLVARLKGSTSTTVGSGNTYIKGSLVVLPCSSQCVPLMKLRSAHDHFLLSYHCHFLALFDTHFHGAATVGKTIYYLAPPNLSEGALEKIKAVPAESVPRGDDCAICFDRLGNERVGELPECKHRFHYDCITAAIHHSNRCPLCKNCIAEPQGKMPTGIMTTALDSSTLCNGYSTIQIEYKITGGVQKPYHSNPGVNFPGTWRLAFLPDDTEGRDLLKRLEYAFLHGLTFTVGTSLTTGKSNQVTWASIHHKTSLSDGPHGYPDPNFYTNIGGELDALGVPAAAAL